MTRDEALLKLLAIEPERRDRLHHITGWPAGETEATLQRLEAARLVVARTTVCGCDDYRVYSACRDPFHH